MKLMMAMALSKMMDQCRLTQILVQQLRQSHMQLIILMLLRKMVKRTRILAMKHSNTCLHVCKLFKTLSLMKRRLNLTESSAKKLSFTCKLMHLTEEQSSHNLLVIYNLLLKISQR